MVEEGGKTIPAALRFGFYCRFSVVHLQAGKTEVPFYETR